MSHRDLLVIDDDGNVIDNRHYRPLSPPISDLDPTPLSDPIEEERIALPVEGGLFRKKPVEVRAVQYLGPEDIGMIENFVGPHNIGPGTEGLIAIWNEPERQWINLPVGHWVIRGVQGEFYPCASDIFEATYDCIEMGTSMVVTAVDEKQPIAFIKALRWAMPLGLKQAKDIHDDIRYSGKSFVVDQDDLTGEMNIPALAEELRRVGATVIVR